MSKAHNGYKTDEFDRPNAGNWTYRIPLDEGQFSEAGRAFARMILLDNSGKRWITHNPRDVHNKDKVRYAIFQTTDNKGRIPGMGKYEHSASWIDFPSHPGGYAGLEMKNGSRGGTDLKGKVHVGHDLAKYISIKTTVDVTPTEIEAAYSEGVNETEVRETIDDAIHWATQDAIKELREKYEKRRQTALKECNHILEEHFGREYYCDCCLFTFGKDELETEGYLQ